MPAGRRHFTLPAADLHAFNRRAEEYAAVAIGFLFEFYSEDKILIVFLVER
jgi:hypothetical protein